MFKNSLGIRTGSCKPRLARSLQKFLIERSHQWRQDPRNMKVSESKLYALMPTRYPIALLILLFHQATFGKNDSWWKSFIVKREVLPAVLILEDAEAPGGRYQIDGELSMLRGGPGLSVLAGLVAFAISTTKVHLSESILVGGGITLMANFFRTLGPIASQTPTFEPFDEKSLFRIKQSFNPLLIDNANRIQLNSLLTAKTATWRERTVTPIEILLHIDHQKQYSFGARIRDTESEEDLGIHPVESVNCQLLSLFR